MSRTDDIFKKLDEYNEEPLEGHFERFEEKLRNHRRKNLIYASALKIAAVFVFVLLSAGLFFWLKDQKDSLRLASAQNEELREAGIYYTNLINSEIGRASCRERV
jgi:hypothetical protein